MKVEDGSGVILYVAIYLTWAFANSSRDFSPYMMRGIRYCVYIAYIESAFRFRSVSTPRRLVGASTPQFTQEERECELGEA